MIVLSDDMVTAGAAAYDDVMSKQQFLRNYFSSDDGDSGEKAVSLIVLESVLPIIEENLLQEIVQHLYTILDNKCSVTEEPEDDEVMKLAKLLVRVAGLALWNYDYRNLREAGVTLDYDDWDNYENEYSYVVAAVLAAALPLMLPEQ